MVAVESRREVRDAILKYMRGEIDNFKFDSILFCHSFEDKSLEVIASELWGTYDDVFRHKIRVSKIGWQAYRRCAAFLETDCEAIKSRCGTDLDLAIWPFPDRRSIFANRRRFLRPQLPRYDPTIHNGKIVLGLLGMSVPWWALPLAGALTFAAVSIWLFCHH